MDRTLLEALEFSYMAHYGQTYGGKQPYILHPIRVALRFKSPHLQTLGLLHDVVEDTKYTLADIQSKFGITIASSMYLLTRDKGKQTYEEYIMGLSVSCTATLIKIADLEDNIYHAKHIFTEYSSLLPRYEKALRYLKGKAPEGF